jgi:hypothetical protein
VLAATQGQGGAPYLTSYERLGPGKTETGRPAVRYGEVDRHGRLQRIFNLERGAGGSWVVTSWALVPVRPRQLTNRADPAPH